METEEEWREGEEWRVQVTRVLVWEGVGGNREFLVGIEGEANGGGKEGKYLKPLRRNGGSFDSSMHMLPTKLQPQVQDAKDPANCGPPFILCQ